MSELAKSVDHTFLKAAGEKDAVRKLCREAKKYGFASVCVNPAEVPLAAKLLKDVPAAAERCAACRARLEAEYTLPGAFKAYKKWMLNG